MNRDQFWLTDEQLSKIAPHLSTDTGGKARFRSSRDQRHRLCLEIGRPLDRRAAGLWTQENWTPPNTMIFGSRRLSTCRLLAVWTFQAV